MNIETDISNNFYVIKNDKTLNRATSKISNIFDYQKDQLDKAFKYCSNFRHAIDIGANYGIMSYNISKKFKKVSAFEIVPEICYCLKLNVEKFNLTNVDIYDVGLGDTEKEVALNFNAEKTFSTHINLEFNNNISSKIKSLDSFNFDDVDFIKIDAEGFEPLIVKGGLKTILKNKPVILYERKGHEERYGFNKNSVLEFLKPYGYKDLEFINNKNGLIGI